MNKMPATLTHTHTRTQLFDSRRTRPEMSRLLHCMRSQHESHSVGKMSIFFFSSSQTFMFLNGIQDIYAEYRFPLLLWWCVVCIYMVALAYRIFRNSAFPFSISFLLNSFSLALDVCWKNVFYQDHIVYTIFPNLNSSHAAFGACRSEQ